MKRVLVNSTQKLTDLIRLGLSLCVLQVEEAADLRVRDPLVNILGDSRPGEVLIGVGSVVQSFQRAHSSHLLREDRQHHRGGYVRRPGIDVSSEVEPRRGRIDHVSFPTFHSFQGLVSQVRWDC